MARARSDSSSVSTRSSGVPDAESPGSYPELLSIAVHELRGSAGVVAGYLRMLQGGTASPLNDGQRKMIDDTAKSCARLVAIIEELSQVGKLDAGLVKLARQPTDAFPLVAEVAGLVHQANDREVRLEVRGHADGATLAGDATWLRRAFDAIFRAILREKAGHCVVVAERRIVIIADEASVQAAYDREPGPFDEKRGGMGLALPLARRVIEGHGGRVWAPAPIEAPREPGSTWNNDPLARGSAVISLPITELAR
jgi:signal transduction histidine kinase